MSSYPNTCCNTPANLIPQETNKPDLVMVKCQVCGCRHFTLNVDPLILGIAPAQLA